jgi:hypothetical protein
MISSELTTQIKSIDLPELARREGLELRRAGADKLQGLCPFHQERTPSFTIYQNTNSFYCYGCGVGGDSVNFIRKLKGLNFPDALSYLGIENKKPSKKTVARIQREREAKQAAKWRERDVAHTLAKMIRAINRKMATMEMVDIYNGFGLLDQLHQYEHCHDILIHGSKEEKAEVLKELRHMPIERQTLFDRSFDYKGWLSQTLLNQGEEKKQRKNKGAGSYERINFFN